MNPDTIGLYILYAIIAVVGTAGYGLLWLCLAKVYDVAGRSTTFAIAVPTLTVLFVAGVISALFSWVVAFALASAFLIYETWLYELLSFPSLSKAVAKLRSSAS